jgi:fibronectin type III domain protein
MRKTPFALLLVLLLLPSLAAAAGPQAQPGAWPSLAKQLAADEVRPGTALERFIRANQDFRLLRPEEASDNIRIPLWLRVAWRKANPEGTYSAADPTGGYPLVLKEVAEWMSIHQNLRPGRREADVDPNLAKVSAGSNQRVSGAQTVPRSESAISINPFDSNKVIAASNNIGGSGMQGQYFSTDAGATWGQTTLPLVTGDSFHSDPTVEWTSDGTAWATTIGINSTGTTLKMRAYKSTNSGATWSFDNTFSGTQTNTDKQMIWVDHSATSSFKDNIYAIWHNGLPVFVNRRTGPGGAWQTQFQVSGSETTGTGIGADIKTNSFGDVFAAWPDTGSRGIYLVKSTNGGVSYGARLRIATTFDSFDIGVPSFAGRRILIYVTLGAYRTASKNLVYATWTDLSGATGCTSSANEPGTNAASSCKSRIWFARSTDGGSTWSTPVKINDQASLNDQYNQWLAVDEATGRVSIIYYDTVADSTRKKTDVWYQSSNDDGATWSAAFKVTTAQTDETVSGADSGNQYGDYNGLAAFNSVIFPSWTDRRNAAREEIWTAKLSEAACTAPAPPTGVTATAVASNQINLSWTAASGATEYHVYRSTTSGGPYTQVGTTTGTTFSNTGLTCNTTYFYVVRSFAGCESGNSNQASATTGACAGCTTTTLYSDGFETSTGLAGWSVGTFLSGGSTTSWRGVQTCTAATGTRIFRYGGLACTDNYSSNNFNFAQPNGAGGIAVPAGSTTTRLSFQHRRNFESGFDGGTLTVSVNGTNYFFVPAAAILSGSYNGTTSTACPPSGAGGVAVFTGVSSSFTTTTVDLDAACNIATGGTGGCAGQSVRIGFTSITDCSVTDDGWFLDNVTVTACTP